MGIRAGTLRLGGLVRGGSGPGDPGFSHTTTRRLEGYGCWTEGRNFAAWWLGASGSGTDEPKTISHKGTEARRENGIHPGLCGFVA